MLIYIHKEQQLDDVEKRYPARHYVLVDDKLRILTAVKKVWGIAPDDRLPATGALRARSARRSPTYPPADITIERIGDLLQLDRDVFLTGFDKHNR